MKTITDLEVGSGASFTIQITEDLVARFAELTGDDNPLHTDQSFAEKTPFGSRIAHGMLTSSMVSALIAKHIAGPASFCLGQNYEFLQPVRIGEVLELHAKVVRKSESQGVAFVSVEAANESGTVVLKGEIKTAFLLRGVPLI